MLMLCSLSLALASSPLPAKTLGMYVLVADDTDKTYNSTHQWKPALHEFQQKGANILYLTFLNPALMPAVPPAFASLAKSRGTGAPGAVPTGTSIIFAIGGQAYSERPNPWEWLTSASKAEAMAAEVAKWPALHGCDGAALLLFVASRYKTSHKLQVTHASGHKLRAPSNRNRSGHRDRRGRRVGRGRQPGRLRRQAQGSRAGHDRDPARLWLPLVRPRGQPPA